MIDIARAGSSRATPRPHNGHARHRGRAHHHGPNDPDYRHSHATHAHGNGHGNGASAQPALARARQISESAGIPVEYLRKVLQRLTRARLVESERGRGGGFRLGRPPAKITLLHIVEALEGPVDEIALLADGFLTGRVGRSHPQLRHWRKEASVGLRELLKATTLTDLM